MSADPKLPPRKVVLARGHAASMIAGGYRLKQSLDGKPVDESDCILTYLERSGDPA